MKKVIHTIFFTTENFSLAGAGARLGSIWFGAALAPVIKAGSATLALHLPPLVTFCTVVLSFIIIVILLAR